MSTNFFCLFPRMCHVESNYGKLALLTQIIYSSQLKNVLFVLYILFPAAPLFTSSMAYRRQLRVPSKISDNLKKTNKIKD